MLDTCSPLNPCFIHHLTLGPHLPGVNLRLIAHLLSFRLGSPKHQSSSLNQQFLTTAPRQLPLYSVFPSYS